jgi:hypothetical protein
MSGDILALRLNVSVNRNYCQKELRVQSVIPDAP